jgi:hypothetical protein
VIRLDQPINFCDYYDNMKAYSVSTINTITLVDLEESTKIVDITAAVEYVILIKSIF